MASTTKTKSHCRSRRQRTSHRSGRQRWAPLLSHTPTQLGLARSHARHEHETKPKPIFRLRVSCVDCSYQFPIQFHLWVLLGNCQDLPTDMYIDGAPPPGVQAWALSYPWSAHMHPDPSGGKIREFAAVLKKHGATSDDPFFRGCLQAALVTWLWRSPQHPSGNRIMFD